MIIEELSRIDKIQEKNIAVLIRHGERFEIKSSEFGNEILLTEKGKFDSEELGKALLNYPVRKIYTSPIHRCVQTAEYIKKGLNKNVEIVVNDELGNPGFHILDAKIAGETYLRDGFKKVFNDFISGKTPEGWASAEYLQTHALDFLKSKTENFGITFFVTHDCLISNFSFANHIKTYDIENNWVAYLDGCVLDLTDHKKYYKNLFTQYWQYLAINAACKLNLFDLIADGCIKHDSCDGLKKELLQSLISCGLICFENDIYKLTDRGLLFTENYNESLKYACMNWAGVHMTAWQNLDYSICTNLPSFDKVYGKSFWDYLNEKEIELDNYHKAMYEYARDDYAKIGEIIDFSNHSNVIDVGGGYGACISNIKKSYPHLQCYLFDLPMVIEKTTVKNINKIAGDFFIHIPLVADAIILSRVIHDWNDKKAIQIIQNCFYALPTKGILYVIENCSDKIDCDLSLLSLNMAVMCNSFERSSEQYKKIVTSVGFRFLKHLKLNDLQTILIFEK